MTSSRALLVTVVGVVATAIVGCSASMPPAPPLSPPQAVAAPPVAPPVPPATTSPTPTTTTPTTTTPTTTKPTKQKPVTSNQFGDEVDTSKCTNRIDYANDPRSNAELNSIGSKTGKCPKPIDASSGIDPGEAALDACVEQTGMTRNECIADSAAGNAN